MKKLIIFLFLFFSFSTFGQTPSAFNDELEEYIQHTVPVLSVYDLSRNLEEYVLLDTREIEEYNVSHIENAIHVGYEKFSLSSIKDLSKDQKIVLYCSIGYRSEKIGEKLIEAGYSKVYNLYGSIFAWVNEGLNVVDNENRVTSKIHTYNKSWSKWMMNEKMEKVW